MPEPVRTYYRSRTPDGMIWCESRDPDEVRRMTHDVLPLTYERMDVYEFTPGWQSWASAENPQWFTRNAAEQLSQTLRESTEKAQGFGEALRMAGEFLRSETITALVDAGDLLGAQQEMLRLAQERGERSTAAADPVGDEFRERVGDNIDRIGNPEQQSYRSERSRRLKSCVEQWPECQSGEYNPRCCRFPKSCSCTNYYGSNPEEDLEP